ncbi:hypothetical protein [Vulcanisaeta sp. JCM 16159]|uniref:hypothetical protein n=1 Tax=Vulcanisaeta sp. JCM 16159 TaxID=1295371 RepID=UPI0006D22DB9|nr:hypothetical protein [Vulcanisaeta sp. JCM 16159]
MVAIIGEENGRVHYVIAKAEDGIYSEQGSIKYGSIYDAFRRMPRTPEGLYVYRLAAVWTWHWMFVRKAL